MAEGRRQMADGRRQMESVRTNSSFEGVAVKLRVVLSIWSLEKVSPPFEGGVAGTTDYMIVTRFISRPGWLI